MIKNLLSVVAITLISVMAFGQTQVANSDMESWDVSGSYDIPNPTDVWCTPNPGGAITNTFVTFRTNDAHSGSYAAKMETKSIFGILASGTLCTGEFHSDLLNSYIEFGTPFTGRPDVFTGWYKYSPQNYDGHTDTAAIYCQLTARISGQKVLIADAYFYPYQTISVYTQFDINFTYYTNDTPDSITMVFTSSSHGETFEGAAGSTLYIDDINLEYYSDISDNKQTENNINAYYNGENACFRFNETAKGDIKIFTTSGSLVKEEFIEGSSLDINLSDLESGIYIYQYQAIDNRESQSGKIIKW